MITGLWAHRHGVVTNGIVLDENMETLGSRLGRAGYETTWIGKSHLGGWFEPHDEETCPYHELLQTEMGYAWKKRCLLMSVTLMQVESLSIYVVARAIKTA